MKPPVLLLSALLKATFVYASPLVADTDARKKSICGQAGYDAGTESFWGSSDFSYSACLSECTKQDCKSFAYGSGECQLYSVTARSNFVAVGDSPYLFYDSGCTTGTTSTTTSTTIPSNTKTTSTTSATTTTTARTTSQVSTTKAASTTSAAGNNGWARGVSGYPIGSGPYEGFDTEYNKPTQEALSDCYQKCLADSCQAWLWTPNQCDLFTYEPNPNHYSSANGVLLYDVRCGAPVAAYDPSTVKTSATTSASPAVSPIGLICGQPGLFNAHEDQPYGTEYYITDYETATTEAFYDCYQKCVVYDGEYCAGYLWQPDSCLLFAYSPKGPDFEWDPDTTSAIVWDRDCPPPGTSTVSTVTTTAKITSTKQVGSTTTAKGASGSTTKMSTTTTSSKSSTLSSGTTTTTKAMTTTTSSKASTSASTTSISKAASTTTARKTSSLPSTTITNAKSTIPAQTTSKSSTVAFSSTTKTSAQTTPKATTTCTATPKLTATTTTTSAAAASNTYVCGQQGYFSGSSGFHGYPSNYDRPAQQALSECYQYCVNSDEEYCAGWNWSSGSCVLFSYAPEGYHFSTSPGSGSYVWDRRCGAPVASVGGTTTKIATTATVKTSGKTSTASTTSAPR